MSFMSVNRNFFIGRLKDVPKIEKSSKGQDILHFVICCDREQEPSKCDLIPCFAAGGLAQNIAKHLTKGSFLYVEGINQSQIVRFQEKEFIKNEIFVKKAVFLNSVENHKLLLQGGANHG